VRVVSSALGAHARIDVDDQGQGRVVAALSGALDLLNATLIADRLRGIVVQARPQVLALDLAAVDFCDCAALRVLIRVRAEAGAMDCAVTISAASPPVRWLLGLFELGAVFGYPPDAAGPDALGEPSG
jgi:anti-anti-sigma factor